MATQRETLLKQALVLAVDQRDRAVTFLRASPDPAARAFGEELDADKSEGVQELLAVDLDPPAAPPPRVLSLVPQLAQSYKVEQGSLRQRVMEAEAQIEAARHVVKLLIPLAIHALVQASGRSVPYGFPPQTFEEALRFLIDQERRNPARYEAILSHVDQLARDYPTSLSELWQSLRALKVPAHDPA